MGDRKYEAFLLRQLKRSYTTYSVLTWLFLLLVLACIALFIVALVRHVSVAMALALLPTAAGFYIGSNLCRGMKNTYGKAANEMDFGIQHLKYRLPEEYSDETRKLRLEAAKTQNSLLGRIAAYGIIAIVLLAAAVVIAVTKTLHSLLSPMILIALICLLVILGILFFIQAIRYIMDLPKGKEFQEKLILTVSSEGTL